MIFYKETDFIETPIGRIPKEWNYGKLVDFSMTQDSPVQTGPFGAQLHASDYTNQGIPLILIKNVLDGQIIEDDMPRIAETKASELARYRLRAGDIVFSRVGSVGRAAVIKKQQEGWLVSGQMLRVRLENPQIDTDFLSYAIASDWFQKALASRTVGATRKSINTKILSNLPMVVPPLFEQQRIAEIILTVDDAVQKTNEVIAKTERLKKGLMQELLTKGTGHKEFKDTEIGNIPKEWEVRKLKDVIVEARSGFACGKRDKNGILQLRMDSIDTEGWINTEAGVKVPTPENVDDYFLRPKDILFNNTNSVDLIGKTAIFRGEFSRCVYSNHLTRIRVSPTKATAEWISYLLIRKWQLGVFKAICHRHVHQAGINNEDILNIKIPVPPITEQQKITTTILTVDEKLKVERKEKAKLERIKQGLMDLLLTGKIRVKVN